MNHAIVVHVFESDQNASDEKLGLLLRELLLLVQVVAQVTPCYQVSHQEYILKVLKRVEHVDEERVLQLREQFALI
eukprot:CAMPEP_0170457416 /NCGR_PEP_ID=MMETSP0123-20130129/4712_1 /TAXON_ID=182087 /ORGANISM="Favella ehrenbergii, Strain Fehren 1" /LENGTH=75 /DNA_ID=CAMNT_0010721195 /DNA_START=1060 /DNA_END=1287 /DNA_ORIENTATION=-